MGSRISQPQGRQERPHDALDRLAIALARQAARDDHAVQKQEGTRLACRHLQPLFLGPPRPKVDSRPDRGLLPARRA